MTKQNCPPQQGGGLRRRNVKKWSGSWAWPGRESNSSTTMSPIQMNNQTQMRSSIIYHYVERRGLQGRINQNIKRTSRKFLSGTKPCILPTRLFPQHIEQSSFVASNFSDFVSLFWRGSGSCLFMWAVILLVVVVFCVAQCACWWWYWRGLSILGVVCCCFHCCPSLHVAG